MVNTFQFECHFSYYIETFFPHNNEKDGEHLSILSKTDNVTISIIHLTGGVGFISP